MHDVAKPIADSKVKSKRKPIVLAILGVIALVVLIFGIKVLQIGKMMSTPMVMPPTTVSSVVAKEEDWAPALSAIGSVSAVQGTVVSTELGGVVAGNRFPKWRRREKR